MEDIRKFNDPVLRKKAKEIKSFDEELALLVSKMKRIMVENKGIGLAGPQIGETKRVFVFMDIDSGTAKEIINPKILKKGKEKEFFEEGCLSFPGIFLNISRSKEIVLEGYNAEGEKIKMSVGGILARVFQHETDHLNGILFFDRLPVIERIKFKIKNRGFNRFINKKRIP